MKSARRFFRRAFVWRALGGLAGRREGTAAVEFAIILPVALLIMSLVVYGGQVYGVQRKVTLAATTVANLVAQGDNTNNSTITPAQFSQILAYPNLILFPNDPALVQVAISQLRVDSATTLTVTNSWGNAQAGANNKVRPIGQQINFGQIGATDTIAKAFTTSAANSCTPQTKCYVILGEVYYPFQPTGLYVALPPTTLHDSIVMLPRATQCINPPPPPSGC